MTAHEAPKFVEVLTSRKLSFRHPADLVGGNNESKKAFSRREAKVCVSELFFTVANLQSVLTIVVQIQNLTSSIVAFRVRTNSPEKYCVTPSYSIIAPNQDIVVQVSHSKPMLCQLTSDRISIRWSFNLSFFFYFNFLSPTDYPAFQFSRAKYKHQLVSTKCHGAG